MFCRRCVRLLKVRCYSSASNYAPDSAFIEPPRKLNKSERKPWLTHINELKRKSRLEKRERSVVRETTLRPPENGLLVRKLVPVARDVLANRTQLFSCVSRVAQSIPIHVCSICGDVHVGDPPHKIRTCSTAIGLKNKEHTWKRGDVGDILPIVESFHLYDRLGRAVSHNERLQVDRIPAIVELCVQAGIDIPQYPTRRREVPVYRVAGRAIDFEKKFPKHESCGRDISSTSGFWEVSKRWKEDCISLNLPYDLKGYAEQGMESVEKLRLGVTKLMRKYAVQTCGYCPEVQVGPKGHRVRQCQAYKHQMRDGQHAWQEATFDDVFPPVYVWHVRDAAQDPLLIDSLKRYYGKLPAVVELFARAGAKIGQDYQGMMRMDVVVPSLDEVKYVI